MFGSRPSAIGEAGAGSSTPPGSQAPGTGFLGGAQLFSTPFPAISAQRQAEGSSGPAPTTQAPTASPASGAPGDDPRYAAAGFGPAGPSDYFAQRRARFKAELEADPSIRAFLKAVAHREDDRHPEAVIESLMNRQDYSGGTLRRGLTNGFYEPVNKGMIPGALREIESNPALSRRLDAAVDRVLAGSNLLRGATDQGSKNPAGMRQAPNIDWQGGRLQDPITKELYMDFGGGPGGHAGAQRWREQTQAEWAKAGGGTVGQGQAPANPTLAYAAQPGAQPSATGPVRLSGSASGADPRLHAILAEASKSLPEGWSARVTSGLRPGDSRFHGRGMAMDIQLIDPSGRPLANYQAKENYATYERFAQAARQAQQRLHPDLSQDLRWGGYFSGGLGKHGTYGAMDLMHFDLGGRRVGMAAGSWEKGLDPQWGLAWGVKGAGAPQPTSIASAPAQG